MMMTTITRTMTAMTKTTRTIIMSKVSQLWDLIETWGFHKDLHMEPPMCRTAISGYKSIVGYEQMSLLIMIVYSHKRTYVRDSNIKYNVIRKCLTT